MQWSFKKDSITTIVALLVFVLSLWFLVSQPTLEPQSQEGQAKYVKAENLKQQLYTMVEKFNDRSYENMEVLNAMAGYLHDELALYADEVHYQTYTLNGLLLDEEYEYKNVIATFKGRESCDEELMVVGAHYDTYRGYMGANDNTSAVAGLLELARLLKLHRPQCNTELVAYTLEEPPAFATEKMGSFIHAKRLKEQGVKVRLALVMEVIGSFSDEPNSQHYPIPLMDWYYPTVANYIAVVSNLSNIFSVREVKDVLKKSSDLPVYSINAPSFIEGVDFSDHRNYWKFDYPALMITDTAFYRSNTYHTTKDTPERLDYEKMAKVVEGVFYVVRGDE